MEVSEYESNIDKEAHLLRLKVNYFDTPFA